MNRLVVSTLALVSALIVAYSLLSWNSKRVDCQERSGVLARTMTGWECVAPVGWVQSSELTKFVPDLPDRVKVLPDGSRIMIRDKQTATQAIVYRGSGEPRVNTLASVNCLYWSGSRVSYVVLESGRKVRVPCELPKD